MLGYYTSAFPDSSSSGETLLPVSLGHNIDTPSSSLDQCQNNDMDVPYMSIGSPLFELPHSTSLNRFPSHNADMEQIPQHNVCWWGGSTCFPGGQPLAARCIDVAGFKGIVTDGPSPYFKYPQSGPYYPPPGPFQSNLRDILVLQEDEVDTLLPFSARSDNQSGERQLDLNLETGREPTGRKRQRSESPEQHTPKKRSRYMNYQTGPSSGIHPHQMVTSVNYNTANSLVSPPVSEHPMGVNPLPDSADGTPPALGLDQHISSRYRLDGREGNPDSNSSAGRQHETSRPNIPGNWQCSPLSDAILSDGFSKLAPICPQENDIQFPGAQPIPQLCEGLQPIPKTPLDPFRRTIGGTFRYTNPYHSAGLANPNYGGCASLQHQNYIQLPGDPQSISGAPLDRHSPGLIHYRNLQRWFNEPYGETQSRSLGPRDYDINNASIPYTTPPSSRGVYRPSVFQSAKIQDSISLGIQNTPLFLEKEQNAAIALMELSRTREAGSLVRAELWLEENFSLE